MTRFLHRPAPRHVLHALGLVLAVSVWWLLIYGGADLLAGLRTWRLRAHLPFEPHYPFVPQSVLFYNSLYPLCWLAPFVLRTREELDGLALAMARVTAIAGLCFVLVPVRNVFPPTPDAGSWTGAVALAKAAALTHNFLPSLHVALASVAVAFYARRAGRGWRVFLGMWLLAICLSTLFLHQHYIADVLTGLALGFVTAHPPRRAPRAPACGG